MNLIPNEYEVRDIARIPKRNVKLGPGDIVSLAAVTMAYRLVTGTNHDQNSRYAVISQALYNNGHFWLVRSCNYHVSLWLYNNDTWMPAVCAELVKGTPRFAEQYPLVKQYAEQTDAGYSAVLDAKLK